MEPIDLEEHLASLDHGLLADLIGDARIIELLRVVSQQRELPLGRGGMILDALGGPSAILGERTKRRALFVTLSREQEEHLKESLGVTDL